MKEFEENNWARILYPTMPDVTTKRNNRKYTDLGYGLFAEDKKPVRVYANDNTESNQRNDDETMEKGKSNDWIMPCEGKISGKYNEARSNHTHNGIDIAVPVGTPVKAIEDGKVVIAAGGISGYGNAVYIEHINADGKKVRSEYGHVSEFCVKKGQEIKKGQVIALSGGKKGAAGSGVSQGPHLHLTIREFNQTSNKWEHVNPYNYIKN